MFGGYHPGANLRYAISATRTWRETTGFSGMAAPQIPTAPPPGKTASVFHDTHAAGNHGVYTADRTAVFRCPRSLKRKGGGSRGWGRS
jgi:hypothetical protein